MIDTERMKAAVNNLRLLWTPDDQLEAAEEINRLRDLNKAHEERYQFALEGANADYNKLKRTQAERDELRNALVDLVDYWPTASECDGQPGAGTSPLQRATQLLQKIIS